MTRALNIISHIAKEAREAEHLLPRNEDKQTMVEIRFAAETVLETNKHEQDKRHYQERQSAGNHD